MIRLNFGMHASCLLRSSCRGLILFGSSSNDTWIARAGSLAPLCCSSLHVHDEITPVACLHAAVLPTRETYVWCAFSQSRVHGVVLMCQRSTHGRRVIFVLQTVGWWLPGKSATVKCFEGKHGPPSVVASAATKYLFFNTSIKRFCVCLPSTRRNKQGCTQQVARHRTKPLCIATNPKVHDYTWISQHKTTLSSESNSTKAR